jgi:drug/metabolite transporter (DMT)-like permease
MNQKLVGVSAMMAAAFLWAVETILARYSYSNSDFLHTAAIRCIIITLIAAVYVFATNKGNFKVDKQQFSVLVVIALVAMVFAELVYLYALSKLPIVNVTVLGHIQPIFIALLGYFILKKEKLNKIDYFGIFFMMLAGILVTTKTLQNLLSFKIGTSTDLLVVAAAVAWSFTALLARKYLHELNVGVLVFYRYLIGAIIICSYLIFTSKIEIANVYQIYIGIVIGIGIILYYESLRRLKTAQTAALELASPFFAALLGYLFFKETITSMQFFGMLLMFVGVYFLSRKDA